MAWSFEGSWVVLISGTAFGLSLIFWSLHCCWQERRREAMEASGLLGVRVPEPCGGEDAGVTAGEEAAEPVAEMQDAEAAPQEAQEGEAMLFPVEVGMYELKPAVEELPPAPALPSSPAPRRRRAARRRVSRQLDEQLLLWPDADEPLA